MICPHCLCDVYDVPEQGESTGWTFTTHLIIPSGNKRLVNTLHRHHEYKRSRDAWCWSLRSVMLEQKIPKAAGKRYVHLCRLVPPKGKLYDPDNLVHGVKVCLDAMKREGMIVDDAAKWLAWDVTQERAAESGVRIQLKEIT